MTQLLNILTVRTASSRLPGKCLYPIKALDPETNRRKTLPLILWIARRVQALPGMLIAATTTDKSDDKLANILTRAGVPVYRGSVDDVISRMNGVIESGEFPGVEQAKYIMRILGDCPFLETSLVEHALTRMVETESDAFVYSLDPERWPVYGSREFPLSIQAWRKIVRESPHREHPDQYFHENRSQFKILYHLAPDSVYFRSTYRLEVDYQEDLELVQAVADEVGMLAPLRDVIHFLDRNEEISKTNIMRHEKTGPLQPGTYSNRKRRSWLVGMIGKPIMNWDGDFIRPPSGKATPIFCYSCGETLLGHGWQGRFYLPDGSIMDQGVSRCKNCGLYSRPWQKAIPRSGSILNFSG